MDKEQPYTMLRSTWKVKNAPLTDLGSLYNDMKQDLFFTMANARLQELSQQPDPSFSYASIYNTNWMRGFNATECIMFANEGRSEDAFRTLITELARIKQYGYQSAELERARQIMIRQAEKMLADKPTMDSGDVLWDIIGP